MDAYLSRKRGARDGAIKLSGRFPGRRGIALILALIFLTLIFVLGMTFRIMTEGDIFFVKRLILAHQARYYAESGIDYAMTLRYNSTTPDNLEGTVQLDRGSFHYLVEGASIAPTHITSTGTVGFTNRTVEVWISEPGNLADPGDANALPNNITQGYIEEWTEY